MGEVTVFDPALLAEIDSSLDRLLRPPAAPSAAGLDRIYEAMRYSALAGGKRLRPYLTVLSADLFDVPRQRSIPAGCAVECIHCYSLIHDDLPAMDNSDLRRGRPTAHIAFDEATAILAGDGLLTEAFAILAREEVHPDPAVRVRMTAALAAAAGAPGMVGGQMIDIMAEAGLAAAEDIDLLQALKTGALIRVACSFGGLLAQAEESALAALDTYASRIGLAFQITDDLLDVAGDAGRTGKPVGQDDANNKPTFVDLLGVDGAKTRAADLIAEAEGALSRITGDREPLIRIAGFILNRQV